MKFVINNLRGEPLVCSELNVSLYKEILKVTYGDEPSLVSFIETLYDLFEQLTNKSKSFFVELDVYELFRLLVEVRIQSLGKYCSINVTKNNNKCSLDLDLEDLLKDTEGYISKINLICVEDSDLKIMLGVPKPRRLFEKIQDEYLYFLKSIYVNGTEIDIPDNDSARALFDKLSPKTASQLIDKFEEIVNILSKENLLEKYELDEQRLSFVPSLESLMWFAKLLFNENLEGFYENMFALNHHGHFDASYIETCTPGEYVFFTKKLVATLSDKEKSSQVDPQSLVSPNQEFSGPQ